MVAVLNEHGFNSIEDAKIKEMKGENATWASIAEALGNGRTKDQVKSRYKQLQSPDAESKTEEKGKEGQQKEGEEEPKKLTKAEKKAKAREEGLKKQAGAESKKDGKDEKQAQPARSKDTEPSQVRFCPRQRVLNNFQLVPEKHQGNNRS